MKFSCRTLPDSWLRKSVPDTTVRLMFVSEETRYISSKLKKELSGNLPSPETSIEMGRVLPACPGLFELGEFIIDRPLVKYWPASAHWRCINAKRVMRAYAINAAENN